MAPNLRPSLGGRDDGRLVAADDGNAHRSLVSFLIRYGDGAAPLAKPRRNREYGALHARRTGRRRGNILIRGIDLRTVRVAGNSRNVAGELREGVKGLRTPMTVIVIEEQLLRNNHDGLDGSLVRRQRAVLNGCASGASRKCDERGYKHRSGEVLHTVDLHI